MEHVARNISGVIATNHLPHSHLPFQLRNPASSIDAYQLCHRDREGERERVMEQPTIDAAPTPFAPARDPRSASSQLALTLPAWVPILRSSSSLHSRVQVASQVVSPSRDGVDKSSQFTLDNIRESLIRQEDSLIYNLIERAQYCFNAPTYDSKRFQIPGFDGSLVEFMMKETENLHAKVRRYHSPDEHPFFPKDLPEPILPPIKYPEVLHPAAKSININSLIWKMYFEDLLPALVAEGDDGNYGSTAVCDVLCLQALSKRIHYGKFVAEAKFLEAPSSYTSSIVGQNRKALMECLTFKDVEDSVQRRVELKAMTYGQEINTNGERTNPQYKIDPKLMAKLYGEWVMPLTKQVQVEYFLHRLD
ncbi:hypothetical protein O6H91_16G073300 [Diphasiastrum complanatum]|uniref:Uncharacterized protein n=1 Tax=Diphasiastrum complanatum TaxID=34168 RepID=A0ACC2BDS7_DIPCM|nr:hypothetical protein O6H91_16G073300 [Diphasiastrum complanatum]